MYNIEREKIDRLKQYLLIIKSLKNDKMSEYIDNKYIEYSNKFKLEKENGQFNKRKM